MVKIKNEYLRELLTQAMSGSRDTSETLSKFVDYTTRAMVSGKALCSCGARGYPMHQSYCDVYRYTDVVEK